MDDTTDLTSWFLQSEPEIQYYDGVELSKSEESLVVAYEGGTDIRSLHSYLYLSRAMTYNYDVLRNNSSVVCAYTFPAIV